MKGKCFQTILLSWDSCHHSILFDCAFRVYTSWVQNCALPPLPPPSLRIYVPGFKMEVYLRIARLYLEEADHVSAEAYINRAGMLQSDVDRSDLHVIYKVGCVLSIMR